MVRVFPHFSRLKRRTRSASTNLLKISWGTFLFKLTISTTPSENDFSDALYPHRFIRNLVAISFMMAVHLFIVYLLLHKNDVQPALQGKEKKHLIFLNLHPDTASHHQQNPAADMQLAQVTKPKQKRQEQIRKRSVIAKPTLKVPPLDTPSQLIAKRKKSPLLEEKAAQQNKPAQLAEQAVSENDIILARMKANIQAANYSRKGTNGIFRVLDKGVQTGRFSFRGWIKDARESTWQTYEVDAGVGGSVELALVRRMIQLIREHYSGDFNWESQRLGRVIVLSARQGDTANLERFLMKEFFDGKG